MTKIISETGFFDSQPELKSRKYFRLLISNGRLWVLLIFAMVVLPLLVLASSWLTIETAIWSHLYQTSLVELLKNTLVLIIGVGLGVSVLGVGLAWLTAICDFPGRRFFDWALMLPLAMPAYVLAFVSIGLFDFSGPVQSGIRSVFGSSDWFPQVRSTGGVISVMVLVLYPYVYMLARGAFMSQGPGLMETARILGAGPWSAFFKVSLPMARPAIAAGVALALMETLADFGAVSVFNYDTFTSAIYKAWYGFFNIDVAAQLASLLLLFALMALLTERMTRSRGHYHLARKKDQHRIRLVAWRAVAATLFSSLILAIAFVIPFIQLSIWLLQTGLRELDSRYLGLAWHSVQLALVAGTITLLFAVILAFSQRFYKERWLKFCVSMSTMGYALPGSVLAVGIMISFVWIDDRIAGVLQWFGINSSGPVLVGGTAALLLAYAVRFLAVAFGPVDTGLQTIKPSITSAARSLGATPADVVRRIIVPILTPGLLTAFLLVFVDVMKEMPATLLLRPFGWDTFAVRIYEMTSEGEWERAALPALSLILVGLIPVVILVRRSAH